MILSFKEQFVEKIKQGQKVTTIRKSGRWADGRKIHFWKGSPRNPKSNPYYFGMGVVEKVEHIELWLLKEDEDYLVSVLRRPNGEFYSFDCEYNYDDKDDKIVMDVVALNDGFKDWSELREWFRTTYKKQIRDDGALYLQGLDLIHFTFEGLK